MYTCVYGSFPRVYTVMDDKRLMLVVNCLPCTPFRPFHLSFPASAIPRANGK